MRVAFYEFVNHFGGAIRCDIDLAKGLSAYVDVTMVDPYGACEPFAQAVRDAGFDYRVLYPESKSHYIGGKAGNPVLRALRMLRSVPNLLALRSRTNALMESIQPSVVVSNSFKAACLLATVRSLRDTPLVLYLQGWLPFTPQRMPWYGKRFCRGRCAAILSASHATKAALVCCGIDRDKIFVLHNCIDMDDMLERSGGPLETPLPQADRPVRILLPGAIMRAKGQHTAVQAMRRILDAGHDAVLWIAGDHQPIGRNKYYLDQTKALAEDLGVGDRVEWLGHRADIPQIMAASTVVILPSHTEGLPRIVVEAMALAKPVAATPVGGTLDLILPGITGLFFEIEDAAGLAGCVDRFVGNTAAAARVGKTAQDYLRQNLTVDGQTRKALDVFGRICR